MIILYCVLLSNGCWHIFVIKGKERLLSLGGGGTFDRLEEFFLSKVTFK